MQFIPTYEQALRICEQSGKNENSLSVFYESKFVIDGYDISLFNYRLSHYNDFAEPIKGSDITAFEMRGLCFVHNPDGTSKHFLLLNKFFNIGQVASTSYDIISSYKIKNVYDKLDGSLGNFVKLPNGNVLAKSKMSFESEQALAMGVIYSNNSDIKRFVNYTLDNDIIAIFEYTSPNNRIVLKYDTEKLILLKLRDNKTGKYLNIEDFREHLGNIEVAKNESELSLEDIIELSNTTEGKEGWVIHTVDDNGNDCLVKQKTTWYRNLHGLVTDHIYRENIMIGHILDDNIDDIMCQIPDTSCDERERIDKLTSIVINELTLKTEAIDELMGLFRLTLSEYGGDYDKARSDFSYRFHTHMNFRYVNKIIKTEHLRFIGYENVKDKYDHVKYLHTIKMGNSYECAKMWLRKNTKNLQDARAWLSDKDYDISNF